MLRLLPHAQELLQRSRGSLFNNAISMSGLNKAINLFYGKIFHSTALRLCELKDKISDKLLTLFRFLRSQKLKTLLM